MGEPAESLCGWCLTHRQARAALPIALRGSRTPVRYADVALLASILHDDVLVASLRHLYLEPLERQREGGGTQRAALRAYFEAGRNVSSAAAALTLNRRTLSKRLRAIEQVLGRPLESFGAELELALRLQALDESPGAEA